MRTLSLESLVDMLDMRGGCSWDEMEGGGEMGKGLNAGEPVRKTHRTGVQCISHVGLRRQQVSDIFSTYSPNCVHNFTVTFFHTILLHFSIRCSCTSTYST